MLRALLLCSAGTLLSFSSAALDRHRTIAQFHHTAWTAKDGAPSQTQALAQTEDGYLWIGSERGLFRFDGVLFEEYAPPPGVEWPSHNITSLLATPDGGLWISFAPAGIGFLKDGVFSTFSQPAEVYCFVRDLEGRIWAGTQTGLILFDGSSWLEIGDSWNFRNRRVWSMFVDRDGTLWIAADDTLVLLPRGSTRFQQTSVLTESGIPQIDQEGNGRLWMTEFLQHLRPIKLSDRTAASDEPEVRLKAVKLLFDRDGSMWFTVAGDGIRRIRFPDQLGSRKLESGDGAIESFRIVDGLTDNTATNLLEDREGNIWVSSTKGLDRFRHSHFVPVSLPQGYRDLTLLAGDDGEVWVGSAAKKPLLRIKGDNITTASVPMQIASVYRQSNNVVWWGGQGKIWRQREDHFDFFPQPKGLSFNDLDWLWEVMPDSSNSGLWVGLGDFGLIGIKNNGTWAHDLSVSGLVDRVPSASYKDPHGRIWLGYTGNRVSVVEGDRVRNYTEADGIDIGRIRVIRGSGNHIWLGGESGLALFDEGRFRTVRTKSGAAFGTVSGIVETHDGSLWLNELHGVARILPYETGLLVEDPNHPVTHQNYDFADGLPGAPQMNFRSSTAIEGSDGRLWFATDNGLAWTDPKQLSRNMVPPPVVIRSLETDEKRYDRSAPISLPPGTTAFRIEYTALSLSIPERVRFRYRLLGTGEDWQDAGTRRQVTYNNLGQGDYRFEVIASNNDGVWNETGAKLDFTVEPKWYQTTAFRIIFVIMVALTVWGLYHLRIRQISRLMIARFDERLAERTRLARELHDTLLQTIQGSKMVADNALEQPGNSTQMQRTLQQLSAWLGQATDEGRAALNSLRSSTTETNDLAEALRRATDECRLQELTDVKFSVAGKTKEMHPIVRDEIYRIAYEAIRNACQHSGASRVEIELGYADDVSVRVRDNGSGIDPAVAANGRDGHFGLTGMRERADRIGAKLHITTSSTAGTEVTLVVPGGLLSYNSPNSRSEHR